MKYFHLIKWKKGVMEKKFKLVSRVSSRWKKIGYCIGLTLNDLENYKRETQSNQADCWDKVMQSWLDGQGSSSYPVTWKGLCMLLKDVDREKVAQDLEKALQKAGLGDE